MNEFSLGELLKLAGQRMRADLDERLIAHPGELGGGREQIIRQFLSSYLPNKFEVSSGFAFDCLSKVSKQLDIVVANSLVCPRFETAGRVRFFPCESVVSVGQVRSAVTSREELRDALANLASVKDLDRSANGKAYDSTHGELIDPKTSYLHQIFTFLVITGRSLSADTAGEEVISYLESHHAHLWPNVILSIDQWLITYCCDEGVCPNPMHARGVAIQRASERPDLLIRFYLMLGGAIEVTRVSGLPYWEYLRQAGGWDAEVWTSSADNPPPYLSSILGGY